jgi:hypothetical protein
MSRDPRSNPRAMMGLEHPSDGSVAVPIRNWEGMKLALWRSKVAWEIAAKAAIGLVQGCRHTPECLGEKDELEVCLPTCPDREARLSALVILTAARQFTTIDARRPAEAPYFAPSREFFSEVLAELAASQAELEALRGKTITVPTDATPELEEKT